MAATDADRACLAALCAADGVGPVCVHRLLNAAGALGAPLADVLLLPPDRLAADLGIAPATARAVCGRRDPLADGARMLHRAHVLGLAVFTVLDAAYPARLRDALGDQAPPVLFADGDCALLGRPAVALVGSRRPSSAAARAADRLAAELAGHGSVVVSGGARGIDTIAHRGALSAGATVVIPA